MTAEARHLPVLPPDVAVALESTVTEWGSSRWKEWRRCQRAYDLKYTQGISARARPTDSGDDWDQEDVSYFDIGSVCHSVLRYVQDAVIAGRDPSGWARVIELAPAVGYDLGACYEADRLMGAYWAHYGLDNAGWPEGAELVGVEVPLSARLGTRLHTGRADTLLRIAGELVIVDTKTRSAAIPHDRDKWARGQATNPQFLSLSHMVREGAAAHLHPAQVLADLGAAVPVWVNAIIKTKLPKFDRIMVRPSAAAVADWAASQIDHARELDHALERHAALGLRPLANYSECAPAIGTRCWAFNWCHGSQEERERYYTQHERKGDQS